MSRGAQVNEPIVFARVGWAKKYEGDEEPVGGGNYPNKAEKFNFKVVEGRVYGYFQPSRDHPHRRAKITLERILPGTHGDCLEQVLVVFVAKRPTGGQVVVGWYRNAIVWRHRDDALRPDMPTYKFYVETRATDAFRLEGPDRTCAVEATKGGMRTTGIRYPFRADGSRDQLPFEDRVRQFIAAYQGPSLA